MLALKSLPHPPIPSLPRPISPIFLSSSSFPLKPQSRLHLFAQNPKQPESELKGSNNGGGQTSGDDDMKKNGKGLLNMKWSELLFDPDPDNLVAVGLTGLLAWASVQVLWQLFFISSAILVAALKYSFIAALLIFILITLL